MHTTDNIRALYGLDQLNQWGKFYKTRKNFDIVTGPFTYLLNFTMRLENYWSDHDIEKVVFVACIKRMVYE